MANFLTAGAALIEKLVAGGGIISAATTLVSFIGTAVNVAEGTTASGTDKLTKVLNAVETLVNSSGDELKTEWLTIAQDVETVAEEIVTTFNDVGLFVHKVESVVEQVVDAVKSVA